jgi:hypothetical protein
LKLAGGPVRVLAAPVFDLAVDVDHGEPEPCALTRLAMRRALRRAALEGSFVSRLATAETPFWRAVGDAVAAVAEDLLPA